MLNIKTSPWLRTEPLDAVIFDCDSTLSAVEGITELAKIHHVYTEVHRLTEEAMVKTGINTDMYRQRLRLVQPRESEMQEIADIYWNERTRDVFEVIQALHLLGKAVYVVSAGVQQCVELFANRLNIPSSHVFAVPVQFDQSGNYLDFDHHSSLSTPTGKSQVVAQLRASYQQIALVGDGMNDIEAASSVDRFVGFGGNCYRREIAARSPFYVKSKSMAPVLPLLLTTGEEAQLDPAGKLLYLRGCALIQENQVDVS